MTNLITLTIPNDDHIALRAFGKALEEMALAHGAPLQVKINEEALSNAVAELQQAAPRMMLCCEGDELRDERKEPEVETTAQQVGSLATAQQFDETASFAEIAEAAPTTDSTGTPWDERIHSTSKALNADGTWRLRRKPKDMDEAEWAALVESVKAELQYREQLKEETEQSFDIEQQPVNLDHVSMNDIPEPPVTPPGDDFHTDAGVVTEQTVAGIPPIPVPPVATGAMLDALAAIPVAPLLPPTTPALARLAGDEPEQAWDFPKLMKFLTERHGKIDVATVNTLLAQDGMSSVQELNAHPDKIGPFVARVKAHLGE